MVATRHSHDCVAWCIVSTIDREIGKTIEARIRLRDHKTIRKSHFGRRQFGYMIFAITLTDGQT
jgi:hypothetical protein